MAQNTRHRARMFEWLNGPGAALKYHIPGSTNYLTDLKLRSSGDDTETSRSPKPFPLNPHFVSEKILSEDLRNEIYERVAVRKKTVREVSVEMGVDMRRVAAVVRLVEMEKRWRNEVCFSFSRYLFLVPPFIMMRKQKHFD